jgi:hypothetical protein
MEARSLQETSAEHFQLSLRIRHPSMDPAELSQAFKIQPEHCFRAGDRRESSMGRASAPVHAESYWLGILKPSAHLPDLSFFVDHRSQMTEKAVEAVRRSEIARKQLAAMASSLSWALSLSTTRFLSTHATLLRRVRTEGGQVTLLVSIYSPEVGSFTLAPEASQLLGELGIGIEFELAA